MNGPVGAGLYVAAYCLLRLALRLTLLIYTVVLLSQPTDPTGAVGVLSALGFLCVILAVIRGRTAALAGRKYRESCLRPMARRFGDGRVNMGPGLRLRRAGRRRGFDGQGGLRCYPATVSSVAIAAVLPVANVTELVAGIF